MGSPLRPWIHPAIVCVFLLLAALYESWRLPWAVLLGSPLVALGVFIIPGNFAFVEGHGWPRLHTTGAFSAYGLSR